MSIDFKIQLYERGLNAARLARLLGVDKATTSRWVTRRVPAERVADVERVTGIPREVLRPDLFGKRRETESAA